MSARVDLKDLGPASQQPFVVMHHVLDVFPVQPGLLLVQAPNLFIALARGYHRFVKSRVVTPTVLLHSLAQTCEALADVTELPLVMVL